MIRKQNKDVDIPDEGERKSQATGKKCVLDVQRRKKRKLKRKRNERDEIIN